MKHLAVLASCVSVATALAGCSPDGASASPAMVSQPGARMPTEPGATDAGGSSSETPPEAKVPAVGECIRVGGDLEAQVTGEDGNYRSKSASVTTVLPVGYPAPTPPGSIDVKSYPLVRRAEVDGKGDPDSGMNGSFWPLFKHIEKHEIAMTAPVEMDYPEGMTEFKKDTRWTMSFLYREREMNGEGQDGQVRVRDAQPMTVVSIGVKGDYTIERMEKARKSLEAWLIANPQWEATGAPRALHYNGPTIRFWNKWSEVQVPVKPSANASRMQ